MDAKTDVVAIFAARLRDPADPSVPVATIQALTEHIGGSRADTMAELIADVDAAAAALRAHTNNCISVAAGCELFSRFVTRMASDAPGDFGAFRAHLVATVGRAFEVRSAACRDKIARNALEFVRDDATVLIHSYSRVVMTLLVRAAEANRRFRVLVTEARPTNRGQRAAAELRRHGIPASVILDAAVGFYVGGVDMVLVGAEGVVENGGIINQVGTYQLAVMAAAAGVPFYAVAESYKFVRCYPLSQRDLPTMTSALVHSGDMALPGAPAGDDGAALLDAGHPTIDYTPPGYIALLFTDVGVLTPSAVSDELIKLYF